MQNLPTVCNTEAFPQRIQILLQSCNCLTVFNVERCFIHKSFDHAGIFAAKLIVNNSQHLFPVFLIVELLSQFHQFKFGDGLNFHVDQKLPEFLVDVINHQNDIAIFQTLPVEIGLKFRDNGIAGLLVDDAELFDLVNHAKVCGNVHALVMGRCARIPVDFAGELLKMHTQHGKTNELKVGRIKFNVIFKQ